MTLDELRARNPELRFAVYAYEPNGGDVVFEVLAPDGQSFQHAAPTLESAIALAYPPSPTATSEPTPADDIFA